MDKSSKHTPLDTQTYHEVPIHGLDFRRQNPLAPEPIPEKQPRKVVHAYTLHARSNDRLKAAATPVEAGTQEVPLSAKG
jgi:hypothetical protein